MVMLKKKKKIKKKKKSYARREGFKFWISLVGDDVCYI